VNWSFVRREWGAVTFALTVLLGMIVVPTALYFGNQSISRSSNSSTIASTARSATPSTTASTARSATP
jgi:hypothetical protein